MRGVWTVAVVVGLLALGAPVAEAAAPRCPAAKLTVVVDGKRSCKARSTFRAIRPASSYQAQIAGALLGDPLVQPLAPRLDNGKRLGPAISPALAAALRRGFAQGEAAALAAAEELAKPDAQRRLAARAAPLAAPATTVSKPVVSGAVNIDKATGTGRATMGFEVTATTGKGTATIGADLDFTVTAGEAATMGVRLKTATDDGSGLRKSSMGGATLTMSQGAVCPDATGRIEWKNTSGTTNTETLGQRIGPINVGNIAKTYTIKTKVTAIGQLSADASLESISYTVVVDADFAQSGQALAFFQARSRVKGKATAAGRLDPKTGQPLGGGSVTVTTSATGDEVPTVRADIAREVEEAARKVLGDVQKQMRDAEQRAQQGECTRIDPSPSSPASLEIGQTQGVLTELLLNSGGRAEKVRWTATATKGSVAPPTSVESDGRGRFTVTTVGPGPEIASMKIRAVSPAGISETVWVAKEVLPEVLVATFSSKQTAFDGLITYVWNGTARFVRDTTPSATSDARWKLDTLTVPAYTATFPGDCTGTATYSGTPPTQGGSIDLVYHPDGSRGYRMNVAWTFPELILVSYTGDNCPAPQRIFQPAASALTNGPLEIPAVTTRPFVAFPFDDTFSAGDPGWTYDTTAHVAAE